MSSLSLDGAWLVACGVDELVELVRENKVRSACFFRAQRKLPRSTFDALCAALPSNSTLEVLDFDHCEIAQWADGVSALLAACAGLPSLSGINLNACKVQDADARAIAAFLATDPPLRRMWLYSNQITVAGAADLYQAVVTRNSNLECLDLRNNGLDVAQAQRMCAEACSAPPRPLGLKELCRLAVLRGRVRYKPHVSLFAGDAVPDWDLAAAAEAALCGDGPDAPAAAAGSVGVAGRPQRGGGGLVAERWAHGHTGTLTQRPARYSPPPGTGRSSGSR
eukprot:TRINITY_DN8504_c0_g2_i1.p1 TRINITY_DN8504_c0_g2~~TRINITY_DN8504_c0_g2_i1.p1  ORF type:complete len:279 (+),score=82.60 TRINITY_DN8504_c0_g2_i1:79-915(+)